MPADVSFGTLTAHPDRAVDQPSTTGLISVVVPTFREADNIPHVIERLAALRDASHPIELILSDDDSRDGTVELIDRRALSWVRLLVRTQDRGLSPAVLAGLAIVRGDYLVVMDADLSHPPEKIPALIAELDDGSEFAVGSRFVDGGSTDDDWGIFRWLNSRVATLLARPLTAIKDPMSGFFAIRRETFRAGRDFSPIGYKIGLELMIKCRCARVTEVPIHFTDRCRGQSKLCFSEQLRYLQHVRRLYIHKYGTWSHLVQFGVVGFSGVFVNLAVLTALIALGVAHKPAIAASIVLSMTWNFVLNRRFSFSYARQAPLLRQYLGFAAACSVGAVTNYVTTVAILSAWPAMRFPQVAALVGVAVGMGFNFLISRFMVFKRKHVTKNTCPAKA